MDRLVYLDHAATTPLDPRVLEAMMPYLTGLVRQPFGDLSARPRQPPTPCSRRAQDRRGDPRLPHE